MDYDFRKKMSFRQKPESRVPGENRDPFVMVPDFHRDDVWMPDQVRHDEPDNDAALFMAPYIVLPFLILHFSLGCE
jgi:hypothetical protein